MSDPDKTCCVSFLAMLHYVTILCYSHLFFTFSRPSPVDFGEAWCRGPSLGRPATEVWLVCLAVHFHLDRAQADRWDVEGTAEAPGEPIYTDMAHGIFGE